MKYIFTNLIAAFILSTFSFISKSFAQAPSGLFISEYVEGSSNNKALEFYNGTGSAIDLTSGNYVIQMYFNGVTTVGTTISLAGTVAANSVFVLAHSSAGFASSSFVNQTNGSSWYNGDDVIILRKGGATGTIVDVIGQLGFDPGSEWGTGLVSTADNTLRRKAADCTGDVISGDIFDPSVKYDGFATDDFSGLGSHTSSCGTTGASISLAPLSLNFSTTPGTPSAEQTYTVQGNTLTNDITVTAPALSNFGLSTIAGGPYAGSITITAAAANAGPVPVYVIFNPSSAGTQSGNITHVSGSAAANLAVQGTTTSSGGLTPIYNIQGAGSASLLDGNIVTTEGIVTADFQGATQLNGFFIQDTTGDGNSATSDGILVFNSSFSVNVGDYVRLTAEVDEFFNKTELKNVTALTVLSSGNSLMTPVNITLPVNAIADLEAFEGMLVKFSQTLTVTETFTLARFGEVSLSTGGRIFNPTNFVDPNDNPASGTTSTGTSNVAAVTAQQSLNDRSRILLDDGSTVQNPAVVPYLDPANNTLRSGSTLTDLTGVLDYDFSVYRVQPTVIPAFNYAARPAVPAVGGNIKAASFNVLNYFNGNGSGGGFPTERGAHTLVEFNRQRVKIINAIKELNADVVGLIEIENDGSSATSAIADLVNGLNAATASGTYAYISDPAGANGNPGTDAIKQAIIYKPAKVTPVGLAIADMNAAHNRPPVAQTFTVNTGGEKFTFIVTHFKSKSCTGASGVNADQSDGQGCYNASRKLQANALLSFIAGIQTSTVDPDVISVGDYNAYEQEDPMDILNAGGLINILTGTYSYVFEGQSGSLDHALVTNSLNATKISGANKWHINADEPIAKDYNQEFNQPYLYSADAFRSSDHDPVLVGLNLQQAISPVVTITNPVDGATFNPGNTISLQAEASDADGSIVKVEFYNDGIKFAVDSTAPYEYSGSGIEAGIYTVTAKAFDNNGDSTVSDTVRITVINCTSSGSISAEGFVNITGSAVTDLTNHPDYPNNPSVTAALTKFEYGNNIGDNYGARVRGYICVPQTGYYTFYIASDDQSELWLSTDDNPANKVKIASVNSWVGYRSWFTHPSQRSAPVRLIKGGRYYIETLHKENTGGDHLSVGWVLPNGAFEGPIYGNRLTPFTSSAITQARGVTGFQGLMTTATKANVKTDLIHGLHVNTTPNPSSTHFILNIKSDKTDVSTVTITDVMGRVVEKKSNVAANSNLQFGNKYQPGIYFVEVQQGSERKIIKLVKQ